MVRIPECSPQRRTAIRKMDAAERALAYAEIRQLAAAYAFFSTYDIDALVELYVPDVRISSTLSGKHRLHPVDDRHPARWASPF